MKIFVLLPLLIALGSCNKPEPVDQKDKTDQQISIKSPKGSLEESIIGKVITVALNERMQPQMIFSANGVMLLNGPDGNLEDRGLTYKIKGNEVLIFEDGERDVGILFSSSIPKVGDQVEIGPEDDKRNVTIIKIEAANEIINDPVRLKQQEVDSALSVEQAEALLARGLGQWEGSGVIKGADGEVLAEIPLVSTVRWLEEGDEGFRKNGKESGESKVQQMRVTEKLPQGDNVMVLTRWYDSRKGLFLLTRRLPGEELPVDPGAEETYEADTETYIGIVRKGIPPDTSFTWTSQMTSEKWIYRGKFLENGKLGWTRVDTQKPVKAEPIDSLDSSVAEISIWDAIYQGNIEAVKKNLARGFDIASKDAIYDGTPLHHAAYSGQNEVALFLINKGANVNAIGGPKRYPAMETPLDVAIRRAQNRTIDLLRKHGAKTVKELKAEAE
ncbi:MAG: ankyrin repeat domain-containing protein [Akkermansiaceae bacterium]